MANPPIQWREPQDFASGDTLLFQRFLANYLPGDGWHIHYAVTQNLPAGAKLVFSFDSTQSTTDPTCHSINVPNFGRGLAAGDYTLSGQVVNPAGNASMNVAAGEKHTIYYGQLTLDPDLTDGLAAAPIVTFVQSMIPILEAKITRLESYDLSETDVQRTRMIVEDKNKTYERYWRLLEFRNYELKRERNTNTGIDQNYVRPVFSGGW